MSQKCEIVYVVTHEAKLDGKWEKAGRVFLHQDDAEREIRLLSNPIHKAWVRKVPAKPELMVMYK